MIKCDKERFECKGEVFLCEAEFELIFMNYFEVLIKNGGLEYACNKYSNILERYEKALDIYKKVIKKIFMMYILMLLLMNMKVF